MDPEGVLILTEQDDNHARYVARGLEIFGQEAHLFDMRLYPEHETHTIALGRQAELTIDTNFVSIVRRLSHLSG